MKSIHAFARNHWLLGAMLLVLHSAVYQGLHTPLGRSLLLAHLGLFILWQPLWGPHGRLGWRGASLFFAFTLGFVWLAGWWLLFLWLEVLIGLVGGVVLVDRWERSAYLLALMFLISELLMGCVTQLFPAPASLGPIARHFELGLFAIPAILPFIPSNQGRRVVDLFRGLNTAFMVALVAFSSLLSMYRAGVDYATALSQASLVLAGFLFFLSWLFSPGRGIGGLVALWERSLLNIGTPFEAWLSEVAALAEQEQTPERFARAALESLVQLPWVKGVEWSAADSQDRIGTQTQHQIVSEETALRVTLYTRRRMGPMLLLHSKMLLKLLGHFYVAKLREIELAQRSQLQAIHETGARVTHDIKNLLQSLQTVTSVLQVKPGVPEIPGRVEKALVVLRKQLPHITQRLQLALSKLQAPEATPGQMVELHRWWDEFKLRSIGTNMRFEEDLRAHPTVPAELFDGVVDNLLENAKHKQQLQPGIAIIVKLVADGKEGVRLEVCDNGEALDGQKARSVLTKPVASDTGLGVGLFQAARHAESLGYSLDLSSNENGKVCFTLCKVCGNGAAQ